MSDRVWKRGEPAFVRGHGVGEVIRAEDGHDGTQLAFRDGRLLTFASRHLEAPPPGSAEAARIRSGNSPARANAALAQRRTELDQASLEMVAEICDRADEMGLGLCSFMVTDVRRLIALAKQAPVWIGIDHAAGPDLHWPPGGNAP